MKMRGQGSGIRDQKRGASAKGQGASETRSSSLAPRPWPLAPFSGPRSGLSLLEVLIALGIFVAAFVVLGRLVTWGSEAALESQLRSEAAQLCQTKMAEVRAGAESLTAQHDVPFDDAPGWHWDLECDQQNSVPNLWQVQVRVSRAQGSLPVECALTQWMIDPRYRGSVFDQAAYDSANQGSSSTTSSSPSGSTTGGK